MGVAAQAVSLEVSCSTVGDDFTDAPDSFTMTITPKVMDHLEKLIVYAADSRAMLLARFPDNPLLWEHVEVSFDHFEPTIPADISDGEDEGEGDEDYSGVDFGHGQSDAADLRIDCKAIQFCEDDFRLVANLRNGSTRVETDLISFDLLREKFVELQQMMRSDVTASAVEGAVSLGESAASMSTRKASPGMSL